MKAGGAGSVCVGGDCGSWRNQGTGGPGLRVMVGYAKVRTLLLFGAEKH